MFSQDIRLCGQRGEQTHELKQLWAREVRLVLEEGCRVRRLNGVDYLALLEKRDGVKYDKRQNVERRRHSTLSHVVMSPITGGNMQWARTSP